MICAKNYEHPFMKEALGVEHHECEFCGKTFSKSNILFAHMKMIHKQSKTTITPEKKNSVSVTLISDSQEKAICEFCSIGFVGPQASKSLQIHIKNVHNTLNSNTVSLNSSDQIVESRKWFCEYCKTFFRGQDSFKVHYEYCHNRDEIAM